MPSARENSKIFFYLIALNASNFVLKLLKFAKIAVFKLFAQKNKKGFLLLKIMPLEGSLENFLVTPMIHFKHFLLEQMLYQACAKLHLTSFFSYVRTYAHTSYGRAYSAQLSSSERVSLQRIQSDWRGTVYRLASCSSLGTSAQARPVLVSPSHHQPVCSIKTCARNCAYVRS